MKKHLLALLLVTAFFPAVARADISGGQLSAEDDATYLNYCTSVFGGTESECSCLAKTVIEKMGTDKVSLALSGQRMIYMEPSDETDRQTEADIKKAGSEEALLQNDDDFVKANEAAVETCGGN